MGEAVADGEMPMPSYLKGHPEARLTAEQRDEFVKWCDEQAERIRNSTTNETNQ